MAWWSRALDRDPSPVSSSTRRRRRRYDSHDRHRSPVSIAPLSASDKRVYRSGAPKRRRRHRPIRLPTTSDEAQHGSPLPRRPAEHPHIELSKARGEIAQARSTIAQQQQDLAELRSDLARKNRAYDNQHDALDRVSGANQELRDTLRQRDVEIRFLRLELTVERNRAIERRRQLVRAEDTHRDEIAEIRRATEQQESRRDDLIRKLAGDKAEVERKLDDLQVNWHAIPSVERAMKISLAMTHQLQSRGAMPIWSAAETGDVTAEDVRVVFCQLNEHPFRIPLLLPGSTATSSNTKSCIICANDYCDPIAKSTEHWQQACRGFEGPWTKEVFSFPSPEILPCAHAMDVCKACLRDQIHNQLESKGSKGWNQLSCPVCSRTLKHNEVQKFASKEDFAKYERFYLIEHLSKEPGFRWCLSGTCESGQLYENTRFMPPRICCSACNFAMCFKHQTPWHQGLTCTEYDRKLLHGEDEEKSEKWKRDNTKACPGAGCGLPIQKGDGCFHMTCRECDHEFCWECLADWKEVCSSKLNHKAGCFFRTSLVGPMGIRGTTINTAMGNW